MERKRKECWKGARKPFGEHIYRVTGVNWIRQIWNRWRRHPDGLAVNRIAVEPALRNVCDVYERHSRERDNSSVSSHILAGTIPVSSTRPASTHLCVAFLDTTYSKTNRYGDGHLKNSLDGMWFSEFVKQWYLWRAEKNRARRCLAFLLEFVLSIPNYIFISIFIGLHYKIYFYHARYRIKAL